MLDGVFQDEHGDYPAGTYVPPADQPPHPRLRARLHDLCQALAVRPGRPHQLRIDTSALPFVPAPGLPGVELAPLFEDSSERVRLERWAPDVMIETPLPGGIELLVLDGGFTEGGEELTKYSWLRLPAGASLRARAGRQG